MLNFEIPSVLVVSQDFGKPKFWPAIKTEDPPRRWKNEGSYSLPVRGNDGRDIDLVGRIIIKRSNTAAAGRDYHGMGWDYHNCSDPRNTDNGRCSPNG